MNSNNSIKIHIYDLQGNPVSRDTFIPISFEDYGTLPRFIVSDLNTCDIPKRYNSIAEINPMYRTSY